MKLFFTILLPLLALSTARLAAQGGPAGSPYSSIPQSMVFTAGTTARDAGGQDWAFILWESPAGDLLGGKSFAIYGKAGVAASPAQYARESVVQGRLDPALVAVVLQRAEHLGQDLRSFDRVIRGIHQGTHHPGVAPALAPDRAARTVAVLSKAYTVPNLISSLRTMAMINPTLALCLGSAWTAPMPAATKTYELREWNPAAGTDGAVIGRVTLTGGAPVLLPAAGRPVQVPDTSETSDLCVRLRWGVTDELKRRIMLHQGFRVWRMPWALAQGQGYAATPPTLAQLLVHVAAGQARLVTDSPVYLSEPMSLVEAEDLTGHPERTYLTDDFGLQDDPANFAPPADGAEFGYIVTPRDLLGRNGVPSLAGRGQVRLTRRPGVPKNPAVEIVHGEPDDDGVRPQHFHFSFDQNPNDPRNPTTVYEVYRGTGPATDGFNVPVPGNLAAPIVHTGAGRLTYDDMPPFPFADADQVWFCVRAVRMTPAGTFVSDLSPPVYAALQKHAPPPAPRVADTGRSFCPQPGVVLAGQGVVPEPGTLDDGNFHVRMSCQRLDSLVQWVQFGYQKSDGSDVLLDRVEFAGEDEVEMDFSLTDFNEDQDAAFFCRVDDRDSSLEVPEWRFIRPGGAQAAGQIHEMSFLAAVMTPIALDTAHPVAEYFLYRDQTHVLDSLTVTPGEFNLKGGVAAHDFSLGWVVERLIDNVWTGVGFGRFYAVDAGEELIFQDSTPAGPATAANEYRIISLNRLRHCQTAIPARVTATNSKGRATSVRVCMERDPGADAMEYRLFRRVGGGPLTLWSEGRVPAAGPGSNPICRDDSGLPALGGRVTWYGQLVGGNGAGSALTILETMDVSPQELPRPVLVAPRGAGTAAQPQMRLNWSCPPDGVDKFEITLLQKSGADLPPLPDKVVNAQRMRQKPKVNLFAINWVPPSPLQSFITDRIGSATLGEGPAFTMDLEVEANVTYEVSIQARDSAGNLGASSSVHLFEWKPPPNAGDADIPWPFRGLPAVVSGGEVVNVINDPNRENPLIWPAGDEPRVGFQIGSINMRDNGAEVEFTTEEGVQGVYLLDGDYGRDFNAYLYSAAPRSVRKVLPAALYRQQLPNDEWPVVSGDVIQASPLISRILWTDFPVAPGNEPSGRSFLRDPFIGVRIFPDDGRAALYLLDTTPRAVGASYRYWLVCFGVDSGAPEMVIPATLQEVTP